MASRWSNTFTALGAFFVITTFAVAAFGIALVIYLGGGR
jgi:hypothetical protein